MPARPILFLPNAGPGVGGGHVLRCLSLARALRARGAACVIATPKAGVALVARFGEGLFEALASETIEALSRLCSDMGPAAVVVDHYGLGAREEGAFAGADRRLMALDDLADRPHACDLLLDPGYGRTPAHYVGKVPPGAGLLLGPDYALLRPEFTARRPAAFAPVRESVARVFVSFGLSDVNRIAERAVRLIRSVLPDARIDVAVAGDAPSLPELQRRRGSDPQLRVHADTLDVAGLIADADIAVGAGGSGTWERCCLGAPTVAVAVADNQRPLILALEGAGVLIGGDVEEKDFELSFTAALTRLAEEASLRRAYRERSRALCDGRGAERAADALLSRLDVER